MKTNARQVVAVAVAAVTLINGAFSSKAANTPEADEAAAMMDADTGAAARGKDSAWKPSWTESGLIQIGDSKRPGALKNFCLNAEGNVLACYAPKGKNAKSEAGVRVYSPQGELMKTLALEIAPTAICVGKDGSIYAAGDGRVLKLDSTGKVLASASSPVAQESVTISKETEDMVKEMAKNSRRSYTDELARMKTSLEKRRADVTGLAVTGEDLFLAVPSPSDFSFRVYRFDHALQNPKLVVEKLRGCCGQMDIQTHDGQLWIPHNARHCVETRDRDGKQLAKFGTAGRVKAADFGGCCEPKNLRVLANGDILAAESGPPTCIKRFSASGKFKEVVAVVKNSKGDCVRVTVEASPDGRRYYMLDTTRDAIRVFTPKT